MEDVQSNLQWRFFRSTHNITDEVELYDAKNEAFLDVVIKSFKHKCGKKLIYSEDILTHQKRTYVRKFFYHKNYALWDRMEWPYI